MQGQHCWYSEAITPDIWLTVGLKEILYSTQTPFQKVDILETVPFGRALVLDGRTQSTEADEYIYHEALVYPALMAHPHPKAVFIAGGGEGATLREVLARRDVKNATMVDIDAEVVEICQRFLPSRHQGAFQDPRLTLHITDARDFLIQTSLTFDLIILDLADPLEGGPAYLLYTEEFYRVAQSRLNPGGLLVTQAGPAGPLNYQEVLTPVFNTIRTVFAHAHVYTTFIPSFASPWGFVLASIDPTPLDLSNLEQRVSSQLTKSLKFYDKLTHEALFTLPKYLREGLANENRLITETTPLFMP